MSSPQLWPVSEAEVIQARNSAEEMLPRWTAGTVRTENCVKLQCGLMQCDNGMQIWDVLIHDSYTISNEKKTFALKTKGFYVFPLFKFAVFETKLPLQVPETDEVDCLPGGDVEAARPSLEAGAKLGQDTQAEAAASLVPNGGTSPVPEQPSPGPEVISEDNPVKVERLQQAESLQRQPSRSSIASIKSRIMVRIISASCLCQRILINDYLSTDKP